ncbi:MAG: cytochrome c oxidase accessory protein CcoG [Acetobacteraceae bacterium]|nr:cytochrome c oxidase accessory protein CcoG [Acetobacteraceae bacterium]
MNALPPKAAPPEQPQSLYADRVRVYPRAVKGPVRRAKWAVLVGLLALYYATPWIRWDRGPGLPDQAVLVDMHAPRIFLFWIEIWPQEIYFLTGLLVLGAVGLFAVTSLFGRVWCGFTCPQTVWTDLFLWVERRIEGDRNTRMKRDAGPRDAAWWRRKILKHAAWIGIALATGGAWVFYFTDAPTTLVRLLTLQADPATYFFVGLFTATTYLLAGWAREQVCTYMCPWPRFQAAMLDKDSLVVTYRDWRGEPRGKPDGAHGDCVACHACVHVCPTGIDIRDGQQLECIGCGLCIDACDEVMAKLGRPKGLIAFETLCNLAASQAATRGMPPGEARTAAGMAARRAPRFLRPRTLVYAGVLSAVAVVMLAAFLLRETLSLTAIQDRAPLYVTLSDGSVRNAYTLRITNKRHASEEFRLAVDSPLPLAVAVQGQEGPPRLVSRPDGLSDARVFLTLPPDPPGGRRDGEVTFRLLDAAGRTVASAHAQFHGGRR